MLRLPLRIGSNASACPSLTSSGRTCVAGGSATMPCVAASARSESAPSCVGGRASNRARGSTRRRGDSDGRSRSHATRVETRSRIANEADDRMDRVPERARCVVAIRRGGGGVAVPSQLSQAAERIGILSAALSARRSRWIRTSADRTDTGRPTLMSAWHADTNSCCLIRTRASDTPRGQLAEVHCRGLERTRHDGATSCSSRTSSKRRRAQRHAT